MPEYVVRQVAGFWTVVYGSVMYGRRSTHTEALEDAIRVAARAAAEGSRKVVVLERSDMERQVVWDSAKDSFSSG